MKLLGGIQADVSIRISVLIKDHPHKISMKCQVGF
jgi:hypothetical protein